jgi:tellurite resistance protein TerC
MVMDVAHTDASPFEWIAFNVAACMALSLDLLVSDGARDSAVALRLTCCWVALAMLFAAQLAYLYGRDVSMNFLTGYVVEESLSLDNLFVILLTFESFRIEKIDQHKVLLYGILSAIVLRGGCIFAGLALIERFAWMLQAFGLLLLFAVFRILTEEDEDEDEDEGLGLVDEEGGVSSSSAGMKSNGLMLRLIRLVFRVSEDEAGKGKFFIRDESGRLCATPLMVALIVVEGSDIIFAADSIPAIFGVTTDPYVVYTSNICAILGLR